MLPIRSVYRVQLTADFGFEPLAGVVPYLHRLGISHLYLSPVFRSRAGSQHGYDVTDHGALNPELGGEAGFDSLLAACRGHRMGIVLDIVPNHMAVMSTDNAWWMDVLEHGAASVHAEAFDIDWSPARSSMRNRLLVPALGAPLGETVASGDIRLQFDAEQGAFQVCYQSLRFPVDPRQYPAVLGLVSQRTDLRTALDEAGIQELHSLQDAFASLPPAEPGPPEVRKVRAHEAALLKSRLAQLCLAQPRFAPAVEAALQPGAQAGPDGDEALIALLARQPYRLAYWRVSGEEINYRRFFDVNELAALRIEEPHVFDAVHALVKRLWDAGSIDGVRVDHADGLYDPAAYFDRLRALLSDEPRARRAWIVAEKILGPGEKLPANWNADGTTGYEFAALVTAWLMHGEGSVALQKIHARFAGTRPYAQIAYQSRRDVMRTSLAAEISGLAARLDRLAQLRHDTLDFTLFDLREAIVEVIAHFPVYRTYVREDSPTPEDQQHIRRAVGAACGRKQASQRALRFLEAVLLGDLDGDRHLEAAALTFAMKFQQVSAPVMAKGIEDTAYYRYSCLLPMNEVGGDPTCRGIATDVLHRANEARQRESPRSLLATSTHDTKRGEDARYRLCTLSEMPQPWSAALSRWRRLKGRGTEARKVSGDLQYLLLQTLLAIWPSQSVSAEDAADLRRRLSAYALKAAREAKEQTSWLDPDEEFEAALGHYVQLLLPAEGATGFVRYFESVLARATWFGMLNALSATVLKLTSPGIPDTYQGNERPAFVLVDPDNRRTPDYAAHASALETLREEGGADAGGLAARLLASCTDGRLKHFITWRLLQLRRNCAALSEQGAYLPLTVEGALAAHLCAFARVHEGSCVIVTVSRWAATLSPEGLTAPLGACWQDAFVQLPEGVPDGDYSDALTGQSRRVPVTPGSSRGFAVAAVLGTLPVSVLASRARS